MNRETMEHFSNLPKIDHRRSKFNMSHSIKTTFNTGDIVPIFCDADILPADTVEMDMAEIIRMATPIYPVMDNMVMDLYWFFIPHRIVWDHWVNFWGENDDPWIQDTEYQIPQITIPEGGYTEGTIADYMGIPTYKDGTTINALPFRAYAKVISDWFRDENLQYTCHIYTDETTRTGSNGNNYVTDPELGGMPVKACKMHDYFTSALPSPQKGEPVAIPLGTWAPVAARWNDGYNFQDPVIIPSNLRAYPSLINQENKPIQPNSPIVLGNKNEGGSLIPYEPPKASHMAGYQVKETAQTQTPFPLELNYTHIGFNNLWTDLSSATAATIAQLRTAFAIQKYYEAAGRNGTRYIEYLSSVFGVTSSDARVQRSEYLGGTRIPINIDQVLQTSSTDSVTPQGNTAGFSCTISNDNMFTKSFEEHGTLLCLAVCRTEHTYQQGLDKMWSRKKWYDFYNPYFANLSEQSVYNKELYLSGTNESTYSKNNETFGYQEAWAEYRYKQNRVTGHMRSNSPTGSLDAWHYADDYATMPMLGEEWIVEPTNNVDRTLAVSSQLANQFIADFYFKCSYVRNMPIYSIPGLIDHV